jgi:REP element-mobilizing transposase RayT
MTLSLTDPMQGSVNDNVFFVFDIFHSAMLISRLAAMARKLRIQYQGAIYHVMNRGDHREEIYRDDDDRRRFLSTLGESCEKTGWQIHSFCLMPNHFHLVIETPNANLVEGMKWLLGVYTSRFNRRHELFGHLFSGRYKTLIVDGSGNGYLKTVCDYVHLNPARAGLLAPGQPLESYRWSSYPLYLLEAGLRPVWLRVDRLLGEWGIGWDSPAARRQFAALVEARRQGEADQEFRPLRRGWMLGSEEFRQEMLEHIEQERGRWHYGAELGESGLAKAERLISEALRVGGTSENELAGWRKGHPFKLRLALRLRAETTVTVGWIAQRLRMGTRGHLAHLLYRHQHGEDRQPLLNQPGLGI